MRPRAEVLHPGLLWNEAIERDIQSVEANSATGARATTSDSSGGESGRRWRRRRATRTAEHPDQRRQQQLFALEDGVEIVAAPVTIADPDEPLGTHVLVLADQSGGQERWHAVGVGKAPTDGQADDAATAARDQVQIPTDVANRLQPLLRPGTTMMITDLPATADALGQGLRGARPGGDVLSAEAGARPVSAMKPGRRALSAGAGRARRAGRRPRG